MNQTKPQPNGLTVRQAAALVGVREYDVREGIANGDIPHTFRIVVETTDVQTWAQRRTEQANS